MSKDIKGFARVLTLTSPEETAALGARIAAGLMPGDTVALEGDLGAGKTTLARAILRSLGAGGAIPSPTFTLVQQYDTKMPVSHFDLYRVEDPSELDELGLDEATANGVALIEWPERAAGRLPEGALHIMLRTTGDETREATLQGPARWAARFSENESDAV
jgi:tRNA threonylcarbamoyl adenosine modification protein YjeE